MDEFVGGTPRPAIAILKAVRLGHPKRGCNVGAKNLFTIGGRDMRFKRLRFAGRSEGSLEAPDEHPVKGFARGKKTIRKPD